MLELRCRWLLVFLCFVQLACAEVANFGYNPKGENPTLYDAASDPIIQLDETTFNETVFCGGRDDCTAYLVEFYSDWCGHCRAYAPVYKNMAKDVRSWDNVVRIAAMNCADPANEDTCRSNGVMYFPFIKYFPRNSTHADDGIKLKTYQSVGLMRDQITQAVSTEYEVTHFGDWPNFEPLQQITTYGEMWNGVNENIPHLAIIFEDDEKSLVGTQLLLDLHALKNQIAARRCMKGHVLTEALHITDYPTVAIFKRGENQPVMQSELRRLLFSELEGYLRSQGDLHGLTFSTHKSNTTDVQPAQSNATAATEPSDCEKEPEKCRAQFYVSELDMLKAIRYAILREVSRNGGNLSGSNLTALYQFTDLLANHFPYSTVDLAENGTESFLNASSRARVVFTHMRDFLDQHGLDKPLSVEAWKDEFTKAEEDQGKPFPIIGDWQHCKGSTPQFRGYTCGLWMSFHALTVRSYRNSVYDPNFKPLNILMAIKGWVTSFFGCEHCRTHFIKMTTQTLKMEDNVHKNEDVYLYLWKAHNVVNKRLKGRETEDPKFPKVPFPAPYLCKDCGVDEPTENQNRQVEDYLIKFYSNIRPLIDPTEQQLSQSADPSPSEFSS